MIQAIEPLESIADEIYNDVNDAGRVIKLRVPRVRKMLDEGLKIKEIARLHNQKHQNVSRFCIKHSEILHYLKDKGNVILIYEHKQAIGLTSNGLINDLSDAKCLKKINPYSKVKIIDTLTNNMRLLQGESTENLAIATVDANIEVLDKRIEELKARLVDVPE